MSKNRFAKSIEQVESFKAQPEKQPADIVSSIKAQSKPSSRAYTFYLDDETVEKLKKAAQSQNVSASKMLNHILKNIL